jgi:hypothetical protein
MKHFHATNLHKSWRALIIIAPCLAEQKNGAQIYDDFGKSSEK